MCQHAAMPDRPVELSTGLPETVLPPFSAEAGRRLDGALGQPPERRRDAVADVVAAFPRYLEGWARLGELARDDVEAYACFRVGYHRGLDQLRRAGWKGHGPIPWQHEPNRGFLRSLHMLAVALPQGLHQLRVRLRALGVQPLLKLVEHQQDFLPRRQTTASAQAGKRVH